MTTATTNTVIDQSTDAAFRTWVAEIITAIFTTIGLTQTADTGQINTSTVTRQATINTAAGFVIGRFNDTAQSTSPIFFKLEFGTAGTSLVSPCMWITVGTGSNGSGTITGTTSTRFAITAIPAAPSSTTTAYPSYFCYSAAQGVFCFGWKTTGVSATNCIGALVIARTTNSSGAPTTNGYMVLTTGVTTAATSGGSVQVYNYAAAAFISTITGVNWCAAPFVASASLVAGAGSLGPCWQADPALGINASYGIAVQTELPAGVTITAALVGSTTHTFISISDPYANAAAGNQTNWCLVILFE